MRSDVNLIFSNAMIFNIPKHKVHKEAAKLKEICENMMQRVQNALEKNKNKTIDEDLHTMRMKKLAIGEEEKKRDEDIEV